MCVCEGRGGGGGGSSGERECGEERENAGRKMICKERLGVRGQLAQPPFPVTHRGCHEKDTQALFTRAEERRPLLLITLCRDM